MSRLTIDVTDQQHQSIKALAALEGKSIRDYVLQRIMPSSGDEEAAMRELEAMLRSRLESAARGEVISTSARAIFEKTLSPENI
jgi:hypothetical protein